MVWMWMCVWMCVPLCVVWGALCAELVLPSHPAPFVPPRCVGVATLQCRGPADLLCGCTRLQGLQIEGCALEETEEVVGEASPHAPTTPRRRALLTLNYGTPPLSAASPLKRNPERLRRRETESTITELQKQLVRLLMSSVIFLVWYPVFVRVGEMRGRIRA